MRSRSYLFGLRWLLVVLSFAATPSTAGTSDSIHLNLVLGYTDHGLATTAWKEAVRHRYDAALLDSVVSHMRRVSTSEHAWKELIVSRLEAWRVMTDSLLAPFEGTVPPDTVTILLGLHGGNDAFTFAPSTICFDLGRLHREYGPATAAVQIGRIDRFFAHEYTHLLHKAWAREHPVALTTPLDVALWECLVEGVGNYRSLNRRWVEPGGRLTEHARSVLAQLEPVFVRRISALASADDDEAPRLMEGLSDGRFDRKWGALTVALWLVQETEWDDRRMKPWIDAGPEGVLDLARRYLAEERRSQLPVRR